MTRKINRYSADIDTRLDDEDGFLKELNEEKSDRGSAVLAAALLDESLKRLLAEYFIADSQVANELLGVGRAIGSFGIRVRLAYACGLLKKTTSRVLKVIEDIRNAFSHELHGLTFETAEIKELCAKFGEIKGYRRPFSPKNHYLDAALTTWGEIKAITAQVQDGLRCSPRPDIKPPRFVLETQSSDLAREVCRSDSPPESYEAGERPGDWLQRTAQLAAPEIKEGKDVVGRRTYKGYIYTFQMNNERYQLVKLEKAPGRPKPRTRSA